MFESTESKSRINFLEVLQRSGTKYILTKESLEYLKGVHFPPQGFKKIQQGICFSKKADWLAHLTSIGIDNPFHVRLVTEAALLGGLMESDINPNLIVLSDDAGLFNILKHGLCWIHAERLIKKLEPNNELFAAELASTRNEIWTLYNKLKEYKLVPTLAKANCIEREKVGDVGIPSLVRRKPVLSLAILFGTILITVSVVNRKSQNWGQLLRNRILSTA